MSAPMLLAEFQRQFSQAVRQSCSTVLPALDRPERMMVYQELVFNNIKTFVDACFPVAWACLSEATWHALNQAFVAQHRCSTPFFREIPHEFVLWVQALCEDGPGQLEHQGDCHALPAYLPHLLHYEWLELRVQTHANVSWQLDGSLEPGWQMPGQAMRIGLNSTLQLACYPHAVHKIAPGHAVLEEPTFLMVWRDVRAKSAPTIAQDANFNVQFAALHVASYLLLETLLEAAEAVAGSGNTNAAISCTLEGLAGQLGRSLGTPLDAALLAQELLRLQALGVVGVHAAA